MKESVLNTFPQDLVITSYRNGIKLEEINKEFSKDNFINLNNLLNSPILIYFYNTNHLFKFMNETCAEINGFLSPENSINKSMHNVTNKIHASTLNSNNQQVMNNSKILFFEEEVFIKESYVHGLTVKCPWYDENKIIGVFGFSIAMHDSHKYPITESLFHVVKTGLMGVVGKSINYFSSVSKNQIDNIYFTSRQIDILRGLVRGYTAKLIASKLNLSARTVEMHISNIKIKLNVNSKTQLIEKVIDFFN